jgi:dipeptidyl-peptidase-4
VRALTILLAAWVLAAQVRQHPAVKEIPHDKYIHVVPESKSPVERTYIKSKDGLYIAAAIRRPEGPGPFPALVYFHGAPGGRGMEQLVGWSRGDHGGPVWERFLQEGYVVAVADYRGGPGPIAAPVPPNTVSYIDDGISVIQYVKKLPFVDPAKVGAYAVSLGGNMLLHALQQEKINAAILGAPAVFSFLGAERPTSGGAAALANAKINPGIAEANVARLASPLLILVGTADPLYNLTKSLYEELARAGKPHQVEIYEGAYHDFCMGPQGHARKEPLLDATLDALEISVRFMAQHVKGEK